ncbi:hypothetical protein H9L39_03547 [Fusarium oxysporum f. sp. albedinis]|nr:hypothetical protein H9L39_03547 [Fusarium oxysporum f. sp. albedinis]
MLAVERLLEVFGNSINEVCKLKGWTAAWEEAGCDVDARRSSDADDDATKVPTLFSKPASPTCGWMKGTCIHVQDHVNALLTFVESIQSGPKVIQNLYTIYKLRLGYVTL